MTADEALQQIESLVRAHELTVEAGLVARALGVSKRNFLRNYRSKDLEEHVVGYQIKLPIGIVYRIFLKGLQSSKSGHSAPSDPYGSAPSVILRRATLTTITRSSHV